MGYKMASIKNEEQAKMVLTYCSVEISLYFLETTPYTTTDLFKLLHYQMSMLDAADKWLQDLSKILALCRIASGHSSGTAG